MHRCFRALLALTRSTDDPRRARRGPVAALRPLAHGGLALVLFGAASLLHAATFTVGFEPNCTHERIEDAVQAAELNPGPDYIQLARSLVYEPIAVTIDTAQHLTIEGGVASCYFQIDGNRTIISGLGGARAPVFRIVGRTGSQIRLSQLSIELGDAPIDGRGGGIYYTGNGSLELVNTSLVDNEAGYGGGIFAEGTGSAAELILGENVLVTDNTAYRNGGGIHVDNLEFTMTANGSVVSYNLAEALGGVGGYGGGIAIMGDTFGTFARLSGNGRDGAGLINNNRARYGGGVSVIAPDSNNNVAVLDLRGSDANTMVRLHHNAAIVAGGAVFLDGRGARATLHGTWMRLHENRAPSGAAIHGDGNDYVELQACPGAGTCTFIDRNRSLNPDDTPALGGSAVYAGADFFADRLVMVGNQASAALSVHAATLKNSLLVNNAVGAQVIYGVGNNVAGEGSLSIHGTTIAGNTFSGSSPVSIRADRHVELHRSVVWQPSIHVFGFRAPGFADANSADVIVNSAATLLPDAVRALVADPRFWDPQALDYRPHPASPAVDFHAGLAGGSDLLGAPRDRDLAGVTDRYGGGDIGALELQSDSPLVRNGGFDLDARLWTLGSTRWVIDNGAGAAEFLQSSALVIRYAALRQCIHLPSPGRYRLSVSGRAGTAMAGPVGDTVGFSWTLKGDAGDSCVGGNTVGEGTVDITDTNQWTRSAPVDIEIPSSAWTRNSAVILTLEVENSGSADTTVAHGRFDAIALEAVDSATASIFANGFE